MKQPYIKFKAMRRSSILMALQILAKLPSKPTPSQKIRAINDFIFYDMGFRFPPHSVYAKDIDLYTFLPSVIDFPEKGYAWESLSYICVWHKG